MCFGLSTFAQSQSCCFNFENIFVNISDVTATTTKLFIIHFCHSISLFLSFICVYFKLKDSNIDYTFSWKMFAKTQHFTQVTGLCQLCTREKFFIIFKPDLCTLNSRNKLLSSCRHKCTNLLIMQNRTKKKKTRNLSSCRHKRTNLLIMQNRTKKKKTRNRGR